MIKIAICEDEKLMQDKIKKHILFILEEKNIECEILIFDSGENFLKSNYDDIDILFLDIIMDDLDGMSVARKIREKNSNIEIIFITSINDFIQEGYEVRAFRYLIKPVTFETLKKNFIPCIEEILKNKNNYLILKNNNKVIKIYPKEIFYIEIFNKWLNIHTKNGKVEVRKSLTSIKSELD